MVCPSPSILDLGTLRPFQSHHLIPTADAVGIDAAKGVTDGTSNENPNDSAYFPYLGTPNGGYRTKPGTWSPSAT